MNENDSKSLPAIAIERKYIEKAIINEYSTVKESLFPAYKSSDIEEFHARQSNMRLHEDFSFYLTQISAETFYKGERIWIDLQNPEIHEDDGDSIYIGLAHYLVVNPSSPRWGEVMEEKYWEMWPELPMTVLDFLLGAA